MIKLQKRYFYETLADKETNTGYEHNAQIYNSCFQDHLYDESAISRFEVLTNPYKYNENRPFYATQYQDIFMPYQGRL